MKQTTETLQQTVKVVHRDKSVVIGGMVADVEYEVSKEEADRLVKAKNFELVNQ
jgi:hypothetical protein